MRKKLGLSAIFLSFMLLSFSIHAQQTEEFCAADMEAPWVGFISGFSATNITMRGDDSARNLEDLLQIWESRTIRYHLGAGFSSFTLTRLFGYPDFSPETWSWEGMFGSRHLSGGASASLVPNQPICPNGYKRNYGPYNGPSNQWYCTLENPNFQACPTTPKPDKERGGCGDFEGNPCNVASGNKYQVETDFVGTGSFPLKIQRYYNSDAGTPRPPNSSAGTPGSIFGLQWRHYYDRKIVLSTDEESVHFHGSGGTVYAYVYRPDGKVVAFIYNSVTGEVAPRDTDTVATLTKKGNIWEYRTEEDILEIYEGYTRNAVLIYARPISITKLGGRTHTLEYSEHFLMRVTDDFGRHIDFSYDGEDRIQSITDPNGHQFLYTYDANGYLVKVAYPDNTPGDANDNPTRKYLYADTNHPGALTSLINENGDINGTWTYDASRRTISSERAGGAEKLDFVFNGDGTTSVIENGGETRDYQFTLVEGARKKSNMTASGASESYSYDTEGFLQSYTDRNGVQTSYVYNARGLETSRTEAVGTSSERVFTTTWHPTYRLPASIQVGAKKTDYTYDAKGLLTHSTITDTQTSAARSTQLSYTTEGLLSSIDGPRTDVSDVLNFTYDTVGNLATATNALGHVTTYDLYDQTGRLLQMTGPNGLVTTYVYDERGRIISQTEGTALTTLFSYDGIGQLTSVSLPTGAVLTYTYNAARYLQSIEDNSGNKIEYAYDVRGNRTQEDIFDPNNTLAQTQQQVFDARNRLWKTIGAQNQIAELAYDAKGNLKQTTNPLQHTTTNSFDALDRLVQATDPLGGQMQQSQNQLDQVTQVTDAKGIAMTYTYNALGDLLQEVSADRGTTTNTYDASGNLITRTDARGVVQTTIYDALNRPTSRVHTTVTGVPNIEPISWTYDAGSHGIGRLSSMSDESGTTTYSYDQHGCLLSKAQAVKFGTRTFTQTLSYQYDSNGRLSQTTYPSGAQIGTIYGADGRPTELKVNGNTLIQNITYHPFGAIKGWTWGNGQAHTRSFDLDGRISQHPIGSDTRTLTYDAASQITATVDTNPVYNRSYSYDALGRLTSQIDNTATRQWAFDANSNRTSMQSGSTVYPYTLDANSNRLMSIAGPVAKTYTYDATGNVISDGIINFTWNAAGRLRKIVKGSKIRRYKYNGMGQRIRRQGAVKTRSAFMYDGGGQLISESKAQNINKENWLLEQETIWLDNIPIAVLKKPVATDPVQVYFIHADHLNSPRIIVDQTNTAVWRWDNNQAFGSNLVDKDPDGDGNKFQYNLRFAGQYFDSETRLHYNYFRDYNPEIGRYISSDPIGLAGGLNTYGYVLQNPLTYTDPLGLISFSIDFYAGIGGGITVGVNNDTGKFFGGGRLGIGIGGGVGINILDNGPTTKPRRTDPYGEDCPDLQAGATGTSAGAFGGFGASFGPYGINYGAAGGRYFDGTGDSYSQDPQFWNDFNSLGGNAGISFGAAAGFEVLGW